MGELIDQFLSNFPNLEILMVVKDPGDVASRSEGSFLLYKYQDVPIISQGLNRRLRPFELECDKF